MIGYYPGMNYLNIEQPNMNHLGVTAMDLITTCVATVVTAASATILAIVPDPTDELKLLLMPLIGALLASVPTILLYPERETRPIVFGRAGLSFVLATLLPQTLAIIFASTASFFAHPVIGLGSGVVGYILIYIPIRSAFEGLYRRRKAIAEAVIEQGQQRFMGNIREAVNDSVDNKIHDAVNGPAAQQIIATAQQVAVKLERTAEAVKEAASTQAKTERLR